MKRIVVIGSGIAGLAAAKHFHSKNFNITVLDKGKYPGEELAREKIKNLYLIMALNFLQLNRKNLKKYASLELRIMY